MKKLFYLFFLLYTELLLSQINTINKLEIIPKEIDFKGSVKKITIKNFYLNDKDTVKAISEIDFSKKGKIKSLKKNNDLHYNYWQIIEFDNLERIKSISKNDGSKIVDITNQYFSKKRELPDSTIINPNKKYREKFINIFSNDQVVKHEHYINDTLQEYRLYKYNNDNKISEDLYFAQNNDSAETMTSDKSNNSFQLSFYPEGKTLYEYKTILDTTIIIKILTEYSRKEVLKQIKNKFSDVKITEIYNNNKLDQLEILSIVKDSISKLHYRYNDKKEIESYYNTFTNPKTIITKWTTHKNEKESILTTNIETTNDRFNNWIRKTYSMHNIINHIIERKIEYYDD
ncbi:hypothetical protein BB050_02257 [Flavobacterium anhuiense]|uniref:Uncharacterized protein n=1 Tax=Flavobacterium anhuiense TaxID=459526 RepID=A0AAC9CZY3_9FLAO|nr:hypothetical protein [Flavobacterium anhuiense]AOC95371.1 hypothetical protein BB050_02257 [Flavobacterium anhuiense]